MDSGQERLVFRDRFADRVSLLPIDVILDLSTKQVSNIVKISSPPYISHDLRHGLT